MPYEILDDLFGEDWETVRRNFQNLRKDMNPPVPSARVFNSSNITLTTGVDTALTFNSEAWDNGGMHSTSANTSRLTAPITGLYSFGGAVRFAANATGIRQVSFRINGTTFHVENQPGSAASDQFISATTEFRLMAGDYVELFAFQNSGGNLNVVFDTNLSPQFWMHRVAGYTNQGT